jgi:hypothetical protein
MNRYSSHVYRSEERKSSDENLQSRTQRGINALCTFYLSRIYFVLIQQSRGYSPPPPLSELIQYVTVSRRLEYCAFLMVKMQSGLISDNGICSTWHDNELYALCDELEVVKVMKIGLRWLGQLCRMQGLDPCGKLTILKPEGTRRLGKPELRWLASVEEDLKMGVRNWRRMSQVRDHWRTIVEEDEVSQGL